MADRNTGCNQPKPVKTIENLKAGIKGETTASAKYAAFARKQGKKAMIPLPNFLMQHQSRTFMQITIEKFWKN